MQRHTDECRSRRLRFVADPSQQMAWLDGPDINRLIDGADYLFSNDYEDGLITQKTGWSHEEIVERVGVRVITRGDRGARVEVAGRSRSTSRSRGRPPSVDPTGVGDAFRAGFLAGLVLGGVAGALRAGRLAAVGVCDRGGRHPGVSLRRHVPGAGSPRRTARGRRRDRPAPERVCACDEPTPARLPRVAITYCTQCRWLLRAGWVAQELLTTFTTDLGEVALVPGTGGVFRVEVDDELLWDRTRDGGFPERRPAEATGSRPGRPGSISRPHGGRLTALLDSSSGAARPRLGAARSSRENTGRKRVRCSSRSCTRGRAGLRCA